MKLPREAPKRAWFCDTPMEEKTDGHGTLM